MDKTYCYPDSDVLKNKLNIKDAKKLERIEDEITWNAEIELIKNPIRGNFDFAHLKQIHNALFADLYEWSGKVRTVDISKVNTFCPSQNIDSFANDIFRDLKKNNFLKGLNKQQFAMKFADVYSDLNALHPFREGNGRTLRIFMSQLAKFAGHTIDYSMMDKDKFMDACIESVATGNYKGLFDVFKKIIDVESSNLEIKTHEMEIE